MTARLCHACSLSAFIVSDCFFKNECLKEEKKQGFPPVFSVFFCFFLFSGDAKLRRMLTVPQHDVRSERWPVSLSNDTWAQFKVKPRPQPPPPPLPNRTPHLPPPRPEPQVNLVSREQPAPCARGILWAVLSFPAPCPLNDTRLTATDC